MVGYGSAPGKVILSGEHSVVYGYPALAAAIGLRCNVSVRDFEFGIRIRSDQFDQTITYNFEEIKKVQNNIPVLPKFDNIITAIIGASKVEYLNLDIKITSQIPMAAGLGSSAAVSVATICAISDLYNLNLGIEKISNIAFQAEKIAHGTPSGIDNTITSYGGYLSFENGEIKLKELLEEIPLVIVNSRIPRDTKILVEFVNKRKSEFSGIMKEILSLMGQLPHQMDTAIKNSKYHQLGTLFEINNSLLESIGVGHEKMSKLIWKSKELGALGTKMTGAGGGGCLIALVEKDNINYYVNNMIEENVDVYTTNISPVGAKIGM